jgi:6-pyruvoyltetrahydropterin/6-carboxytetrahydropterin synthase
VEIYKVFTFDAAHQLPNLPDDHKCKRLHGHTFKVQVYVNDQLDDKMGWVIDFYDIKDVVSPIIDQLDHRYLNEIKGLENPTSENISKWLWAKIAPTLPILSQIIVQESPNSGVCYKGD